MTEIKLVHIYGQEAFHDEAYIVGNTEGLISVLRAIEGALKKGASEALVYANDGEGYQIRVILNDSPWDSPSWSYLAAPYSREFACEKREDAIWPWDIRGE
ncbi:MAG: hypothetical protein DDT33_01412 [Firmicutes bacterium]|nr:hypothetical protein [Bacillota bacterium]